MINDAETESPRHLRSCVPSPHAKPKNPRIIDAVLKRPCMILYRLRYALQTHSKDGFIQTIFKQSISLCTPIMNDDDEICCTLW